MAFEELGAVVDLPVHDEPRLMIAIMLPELVEGDITLHFVVHHAYLLLGLLLNHSLLLARDFLSPEPIGKIATRLLDPLHPPARHERRLGRVLES